MNRGGFSWKRLLGVSAAKSRVSRTIGVPLTRSGRQRKAGAAMGCTSFLFLVAAGLIVLGQASQKQTVPEVIRSQRYELVDAAGELKATLACSPDGTTNLYFYDDNMKRRLKLYTEKDGTPHVVLSDAADQVVVEMPDPKKASTITITHKGEPGQVSSTDKASDKPTEAKQADKAPAKPSQVDLVLSDVRMGFNQYGDRVIAGIGTNNSKYTLEYVCVKINLYDAKGVQVGDAIDSSTNLEPGGKWRFEADVIESTATQYKVIEAYGHTK